MADSKRRRDKKQLSCEPCKNRKLRCDRQHPCGACSRRRVVNACNYAVPSSTPDDQGSIGPRQSTSLHDRLSELESLVVTLMKGQSLPTPISMSPRASSALPSDVRPDTRRPKRSTDDATDAGILRLHESGTSYIQSSHWEAVLQKVKSLQEQLLSNRQPAFGSYLFYGPNRHTTPDEILESLPPRSTVDRLMALHFDSYFVTSYLVHSKKFLREYEGFWADPSTASIAWIGLMFSMLYIAAQLQTFTTESLNTEYATMKNTFRERTMQSLILARYTAGGPYVLETLITLLTGEFVLLKDGANNGWLLINIILRIAMRMGYHRDPDHYPGISLSDAEMRRRVWTVILQLDLTLALEMGLPRSATDTQIDTKEPRNLNDSDFDEDTTDMPSSRLETEWTPILPLIARKRLISALGLICDINANINSPSCDEIIRVDALLEDVHKRAIPHALRWQPMAITDSPNVVVQRVSVETTYYKSRILLYRRALIGCCGRQTEEPNRQYVQICLDAALKILSFQELLHQESQPFGRLSQLRWKVIHIFNQDVLLATSVLCLYLEDVDKFELSESAGQTTLSHNAEEIRLRLATSYKIWLSMSSTSVEAAKVARALSIVLESSTDAPGDGDSVSTAYHFATEYDAMPLDFSAGFLSPLAFFDSILEPSSFI